MKKGRIAEALCAAGITGLDEAEFRELEKVCYNELELRVGFALAARCTDTQLEEFEELVLAGDHGGMGSFLDRIVPDHPAIVEAELARIARECSTRLAPQPGSKIPKLITPT